jgi:hypothetical protein
LTGFVVVIGERQAVKPMDERIEAFLADVLALEIEDENAIREGVRVALGSAKEVAQIGAAIGREFSYALLFAVISRPNEELSSALDRIVRLPALRRMPSRCRDTRQQCCQLFY